MGFGQYAKGGLAAAFGVGLLVAWLFPAQGVVTVLAVLLVLMGVAVARGR